MPRTRHDGLAEAVAWTLGRGVVSDESAPVLHGLSDVNPTRIQLTVPRADHPAVPAASCVACTAGTLRRAVAPTLTNCDWPLIKPELKVNCGGTKHARCALGSTCVGRKARDGHDVAL